MRQYCPHCGYPVKTCLCSAVSQIDADLQFVILQDNKEVAHAKNTARLVALTMPQTTIIQVDREGSTKAVAKTLASWRSPALIYPSEASVALERAKAESKLSHDCYILLDGSWKQAYRMLHTLAVLQTLPHYHFNSAPVSEYRIRHTQLAYSLSTLEAVAYTLHTVTGADVYPLHSLQATMQANWQGPPSHRR